MKRILTWSGALAVVVAVSATLSAEEAKGRIKSVDSEKHIVVLKGTLGDSVYELGRAEAVWVDGVRSKLSDLKVDDEAIVVYEKNGDRFKADRIRVLRNAKETTGTVKDVFRDKNEITIKGTVKNTTYELAKNGTVWVDGKEGRLSDIRENDEVTITYEQRGDHYMANDVAVIRRR